MEFIDLKAQYELLKESIDSRICSVIKHGKFILGPEVNDLEEKLQEFTGARFCITCANGTDALQIALMSLGIGHGDEVIVPAFTFIGTAEPISLLGATPIFVDVDPLTFNIDPEKIEPAITGKTKAIIPVSLFGLCAEFDKINSIAKKFDLPVIEDAAQSFGATYKGKLSCNLTDIACTSFFPSKPLGCYGDGGAIFTSNKDIADRARMIARHGQSQRYQHDVIGINSRLDTIQAAILLAKLEIFTKEIILRKHAADRYKTILGQKGQITLQTVPDTLESVYAQFSILTENRDKIISDLGKYSIPTAVHYPIPLNRQKAFINLQCNLEVAEKLSRHIFSLPFHPYITNEQQNIVAEKLLSHTH